MIGSEIAVRLDRAADLIEPEGAWIQSEMFKYDHSHCRTCFCAWGAIIEIGGDSAVSFLEKFLPLYMGYGPRPVVAWNDAPERTQAEVVAKLREVAEIARATGDA